MNADKIEFDDNDLFEKGSSILDLTKANAGTFKNLDPYTLSLYNNSVLKKAIKLGYNVNKQNSNGVTLLHCYARKNPAGRILNAVKFLLENDANRLILTHKGISVLDIAMKYNHPMAKMLITRYNVHRIF